MPDAPQPPLSAMAAYPLITTDRLAEIRRFYVDSLGFGVVFEASWFVLLSAPGDGAALIAFMHPSHPSAPPGPETFTGRGMIWTIQVEDAAAACARVREAGVALHYQLTNEPWASADSCCRIPRDCCWISWSDYAA